jgi:hypothetical protein
MAFCRKSIQKPFQHAFPRKCEKWWNKGTSCFAAASWNSKVSRSTLTITLTLFLAASAWYFHGSHYTSLVCVLKTNTFLIGWVISFFSAKSHENFLNYSFVRQRHKLSMNFKHQTSSFAHFSFKRLLNCPDFFKKTILKFCTALHTEYFTSRLEYTNVATLCSALLPPHNFHTEVHIVFLT